MQLHKINSQGPKESCMITYDPLSGYVDKSVVPKVFSNGLEDCFRSLSINLIYKELSSFINDQLIVAGCTAQLLPQIKPLYFQECYPKSLVENCHKIGEGLYGEVFLFRDPHGGTTTMKIIPIEGCQTVNGESQKKLKEVLSEIIIAIKLSNLRYNRTNRTDCFVQVKNINCVQGKYPDELLELWRLYKETRGSINDSPEIFDKAQRYMILETSYGGCDMESFEFEHAAQAFSMFLQVALAIAIAEETLQFEHRDLHWGNILLSRLPLSEKVTFTFNGKDIKVGSYGIKVTIIDFTMSRITTNGIDVYTDLGKDCSIFNGSGDYQFEIYQLMQKKNGNKWNHFEPYSNILWLSYIIDKAMTSLHYKDSGCKLHKKYMNKLKQLNLEILGYDSAKEFVHSLFGNKFS